MTKLLKKARLSRVGSALDTFGAAVNVARAVENREMPAASALATLGIDEKSFRQIWNPGEGNGDSGVEPSSCPEEIRQKYTSELPS